MRLRITGVDENRVKLSETSYLSLHINSEISPQLPARKLADVSIIIVSYNVAGLLSECLASLFERPPDGLELEVLVVDNASGDGSPELVRHNFPQAQLIANPANYGFPRACNQGRRRATGRYLFFLNPDARLEERALPALVDFMESHPRAGVVGPLLRYADGSLQSNRRRFPSFGLAFVESTILERKPLLRRLPALQRFKYTGTPSAVAHEVDWLVGAAFMVRREVTEQLGGLDERFFMYSEELDYCRRVKAQGWQVWYTPTAEITHQEGRSSAQNVAARYINFHTSKISYYRKYFGRGYAGLLRGFLLGTHLWEYGEEWTKLRLGHKPALRRERLHMLRQVLASRFRPYRPTYSHATTDLDICLLTAEYPPQPGGVGDYTTRLGEALAKAGTGSLRVLDSPFAEKRLAHNSKPQWGWSSLPAILQNLKQHPAHAVNIQYQTGAYNMHPAINCLPLYLRWKLGSERPRIVTTFHDLRVPYLFPKAGPVRNWVNRLLLKSSDVAIVTNEADYEQAIAWGANPARLHLVPIGSNITPGPGFANPAEREVYRAGLGLLPGDFAIGYFGLTNQSKGLDTLLEAVAQLRQTAPGWKLVIIGGEAGGSDPTNQTYARELAALTARLELDRHIIRTGHLAPKETSRALYALDGVALPFRDGASFRRGSLLAPLAHGLPVVTTYPQGQPSSRGKLPQLIAQQNVLLVEPSDPAALATALTRLRHDPALASQLSAGARELSRHFEWDKIASRLLEILGE